MSLRVPYSAFVETGTYDGDTSLFFSERMPVYTSEIDKDRAARASSRMAPGNTLFPVQVLNVSSPTALMRWRSAGVFDKPCVIWLDAHWCGGERRGPECPILIELKQIPNLDEHLIGIDDARMFINPPLPPHNAGHWPSFRELEKAILKLSPNCVVRLIDDTIVVAHKKYDEVLSEPEAVPSGSIHMPKLGVMGRFGNQIFQYMFLRSYARQWNRQPFCPSWVGNELFALPDLSKVLNTPRAEFEELTEHDRDSTRVPHRATALPYTVSVTGYFQYHTSYYYPHRKFIQSLFEPGPDYRQKLERLASSLRDGKKLCVAHIRRGDYGRGYFYQTPIEWYVAALDRVMRSHGPMNLFVATEDVTVLEELQRFKPILIDDVVKKHERIVLAKHNREKYEFKEPRILSFFEDFYMMTQADVLLMPQSTFSFSAAMLNKRNPMVLKSNLAMQGFERIDPWDSQPLDYTHNQANYPNVPGAWLEANAAW